ncbi:MAG: cell division protein ZapD [Methylococcaceae bacterium]|nr:cell division protein ZapD [Methylococcaceae bacterium]
MDSLLQELQRTIGAVEKLAEKPATASEQLDELLDQLFQQKTDLAKLQLNPSVPAYQQALHAVRQAAGKSDRAVKDSGKVGEMVPAVNDAIGKIAKLLDHLAPID